MYAIEHYRKGLDPLKGYIRYENTLESISIDLRIQQDLFEGTLLIFNVKSCPKTKKRLFFLTQI